MIFNSLYLLWYREILVEIIYYRYERRSDYMKIMEATSPKELGMALIDFRFDYISYLDGESIDINEYKTLSIEEILKYNAGRCWDVTAIEEYCFEQNFPNIWHRCYYMESDDGDKTHSWLLYRDPTDMKYRPVFNISYEEYDKWYNSKADYSLEVMIYDTLYAMCKEHTTPSEYHLDREKFRKYIFNTGTLLINSDEYFEKASISLMNKN